jgi:hypothetical protein
VAVVTRCWGNTAATAGFFSSSTALSSVLRSEGKIISSIILLEFASEPDDSDLEDTWNQQHNLIIYKYKPTCDHFLLLTKMKLKPQ